MTLNDYVNMLVTIVNLSTYYSNKYPNNLGYVHSDGRRSFDCWNLIKAILNGYNPNNDTVGYYQKDLSKTGDVDITGLMSQCTSTGTDFSKIKPGAILKYTGGTHAGSYVGEYEIAGKIYNVIECTGSWDKKVLWSWVDPDGTRRHYKGCTSKNGTWVQYGYHKLLQEDAGKQQVNAVKPQDNSGRTHTVQKGDTLWGIAQKYLGSGIKWRLIYEENHLKSTNIMIGQKLIIPQKG